MSAENSIETFWTSHIGKRLLLADVKGNPFEAYVIEVFFIKETYSFYVKFSDGTWRRDVSVLGVLPENKTTYCIPKPTLHDSHS